MNISTKQSCHHSFSFVYSELLTGVFWRWRHRWMSSSLANQVSLCNNNNIITHWTLLYQVALIVNFSTVHFSWPFSVLTNSWTQDNPTHSKE